MRITSFGRAGSAVLALIALASGSVQTAAGQTSTVRGFVHDDETGRALQSATVILRRDGEIRYGSATDGDGFFIISRVVVGRYELSVSFIGYVRHQESIEVTPGRQSVVHVRLVPTDEVLEEIVVEDQADAGITTVSAGLQSVRPDDIQIVPIPGVSGDLAGYLQTLPGVVSQGDRGGQLFIRGGSTDQNLALLDRIPIYQPFHIVSFYSAFPEEIVDHADFYTGGFGAAYGTRLSSVMDVSSRNGNKQRFGGSISVAPFLSAARFEGPIIADHVSFVGSIRQSLVEEITPNFYGQKLPYRFGDRFAKLHAFLGAEHSLSFTALSTDDEGDIAGTLRTFDDEFAPVPEEIDDEREVAWSNDAFGGRYQYHSRFAPLVIEVGASTTKSENRIGPAGSPERIAEIKSRDAFLDANLFTVIGDIHAGLSWRKSDLSFELGGQFQDLEFGGGDVTEWSAFVETTHGLLEGRQLQVNPGINLYVLADRNETKIEPRLRLSWTPDLPRGTHSVNVAAGLYHQTVVGLNDERDVGNVFTVWVRASDSLDVPSSWHFLAGWSSRFAAGYGLAVEAFSKTFRDLSVPVFSPFPSFTTRLQPADGTARGVDLRFEITDRPFIVGSTVTGYVSYTLTDVEYRTAPFSYNPAQHRTHQFNALVRASKGEVGFTLQWQFGTGFPFTESAGFDVWQPLTPETDVASEPGLTRVLYLEPFGGRLPNYERVDAWIDKSVTLGRARATIRAGVVNLLNRDNLFYFDLFTLRRVDHMPLIPSVGAKLELP